RMMPSRAMPNRMRMTPAMRVAICRPSTPCWATIPDRITIKAPVGPAICTRLPPNTETTSPAMIAVYNPCSGLTPEAIAKAMASGRATIPTRTPATRLRIQCARPKRPARYDSVSANIRPLYEHGIWPISRAIAQQPHAIGQDNQAGAHISKDRHPHGRHTQDGKHQKHQLQSQGNRYVLDQYPMRALAQSHKPADFFEIVFHQRDVGGLKRHVRSDHPHGKTNIGAGEGGCIVDAVANHAGHPLRLESFNMLDLVVGEQTAMGFDQACLP